MDDQLMKLSVTGEKKLNCSLLFSVDFFPLTSIKSVFPPRSLIIHM